MIIANKVRPVLPVEPRESVPFTIHTIEDHEKLHSSKDWSRWTRMVSLDLKGILSRNIYTSPKAHELSMSSFDVKNLMPTSGNTYAHLQLICGRIFAILRLRLMHTRILINCITPQEHKISFV